MTTLTVLVAIFGGGGGIAGIITAIVAWKGAGRQQDDSRYNQLDTLVNQYKGIVDEYRQEAGRDEARISSLEKSLHQQEDKTETLTKDHAKCQNRLQEVSESNRELAKKVHILETKVLELGG